MGTFTELIHIHCCHPNWTIGARGACTCRVPQLYELSPWGGEGEACWASQITSYLCASPTGGQNENRKSYTCQHCKYLASAQHPIPHPSASPVDLSAKISTLQGEPPYDGDSLVFTGICGNVDPHKPSRTSLHSSVPLFPKLAEKSNGSLKSSKWCGVGSAAECLPSVHAALGSLGPMDLPDRRTGPSIVSKYPSCFNPSRMHAACLHDPESCSVLHVSLADSHMQTKVFSSHVQLSRLIWGGSHFLHFTHILSRTVCIN